MSSYINNPPSTNNLIGISTPVPTGTGTDFSKINDATITDYGYIQGDVATYPLVFDLLGQKEIYGVSLKKGTLLGGATATVQYTIQIAVSDDNITYTNVTSTDASGSIGYDAGDLHIQYKDYPFYAYTRYVKLIIAITNAYTPAVPDPKVLVYTFRIKKVG
jgi:hypothetical protein